ncbi:hypothetical protein ACWJJH_01240 [Endozoicomonadaceae bacterium StTr2]
MYQDPLEKPTAPPEASPIKTALHKGHQRSMSSGSPAPEVIINIQDEDSDNSQPDSPIESNLDYPFVPGSLMPPDGLHQTRSESDLLKHAASMEDVSKKFIRNRDGTRTPIRHRARQIEKNTSMALITGTARAAKNRRPLSPSKQLVAVSPPPPFTPSPLPKCIVEDTSCASCFEAMNRLRKLYDQLPVKAKSHIAIKSEGVTLERLILRIYAEFFYLHNASSPRKSKAHPEAVKIVSLKNDLKSLKKALPHAYPGYQPFLIEHLWTESIRTITELESAEDFPPKSIYQDFSFDLMTNLFIPFIDTQLLIERELLPAPLSTLFKLRCIYSPIHVRFQKSSIQLEIWALDLLRYVTAGEGFIGKVFNEDDGTEGELVALPESRRMDALKMQMDKLFSASQDIKDIFELYQAQLDISVRMSTEEMDKVVSTFKQFAGIMTRATSFAQDFRDIQQLDIIAGIMFGWVDPTLNTINIPEWAFAYTNCFRFLGKMKWDHQKKAMSPKHIPKAISGGIRRLLLPVQFDVHWETGENLVACLQDPQHTYNSPWPVCKVPSGADKHLIRISKTPSIPQLPPNQMISLAWLYFYQQVMPEHCCCCPEVIRVTDQLFMYLDLIIAELGRNIDEQVKSHYAMVVSKIYPICEEIVLRNGTVETLKQHPIFTELLSLPDQIPSDSSEVTVLFSHFVMKFTSLYEEGLFEGKLPSS